MDFSRILEILKRIFIDSRILYAVLEIVAGIVLIQLLGTTLRRGLEKSRLEKAAHGLILSVTNIVLYVLLGLIVASCLGVDVTGVVALASVLTLAISLALQNMLANVFGGFTLLSTHPFRSGDYVEIGADAGTVEEITMSYTRLVTPDNKVISIPNSVVAAARIVNYSLRSIRRVEITVSASYSDAPQKVIDALVGTAMENEVLTDPAPFAAVTEYGDSAISYVLRFWVKTENYWDAYFRVNQKVSETFAGEGITMTYPHLNVHLDSGKDGN